MEIRTLPVGQLDTNCYIVWEADGQAVVIDPGAQAGRILDEADAAGVRVRAVLLTHVHFDHILAAREIMNATGAELLVPAGDEPALTSPARSLLAMFLPGCRYDLQADRLLVDGDTVTAGGLTLTVMHTPGQQLLHRGRGGFLRGHPVCRGRRPHRFSRRRRGGAAPLPQTPGGLGRGLPGFSRP